MICVQQFPELCGKQYCCSIIGTCKDMAHYDPKAFYVIHYIHTLLNHEVRCLTPLSKNISVTTFVAEIGVPRENHRPVASHWQTLSHVLRVYLGMNGVQTHNLSGGRQWLHR